ncbi:MAG TPA: hypothetical protein VM692_12010 [Gammaproteobacteria bacterium]|nr:hypothetical protein [Gammaproteobacteria bacterium]
MRTQRVIAIGGSRPSREAYAPSDPLAGLLPAGNPRYLRDPWGAEDLSGIGGSHRVLVLGAGLAAVGVVLELDDQGHHAPIRVLSSPALLPHSPRLAPAVAGRLAALLAAGRLELFAGEVRGAAAYGDTFVVDVLPHGRALHSSERYDWIVNCSPASVARPHAPTITEHRWS